jgi:Tol biopolymer transport system component
LAVRDLTTGQNQRLTKKGTWNESFEFALAPRFSADGKFVAYTWFNKDDKFELRVVGLARDDANVLYVDTEPARERYPHPVGWSPDGKTVALSLTDGDASEIALLSVADSALRTVKSFSRDEVKLGEMRLAPDGRTIAYSRAAATGSTNRDIYLIDVTDGQETQVTKGAGDKELLSWTPDGQGLLFTIERQGSHDAWMIRTAPGLPQGEPQLVKPGLGRIIPLGLARNGAFYYGQNFGGPSIFTATFDLEHGTVTAKPLDGEKYSITDQFFIGDWSPGGDALAYKAVTANRTSEIRIVSLKSGQIRVLQPKLGFLSRFGWSADGRSFISASRKERSDAGIGIYRIDAESGDIETIVEPGDGMLPGAAKPSRDGHGVYYGKGWNGIIYRDLKSGSEREILAPENSIFSKRIGVKFDVSPDGLQLAVYGKEASTEATILRLISIADGASRELSRVSDKAGTGWMSFTPDGRFVLFNRYGTDDKRGLWSVSTGGGEPRKLKLSGLDAKTGVQQFVIHPDGKQMAITSPGNRRSEIWMMENFLPPENSSRSR